MPILHNVRKKPANIIVHCTHGAGIYIIWAEFLTNHYDFPNLRYECPCATCNDERIRKSAGAGAGPTSAAALPMFKPKPRAQSATTVGNYAIQITFTDGHSTGIFSYDHLRSICPCADCAKVFRAAT